MFVYYILLIILVIFSVRENKRNQNRLTFIAFLLIFFLFSFRSYDVGIDTTGYIDEYLLQTSEFRGTDIGFTKYNELLYRIGLSARQYLFITSFLICFPVYFFIRKVSDKKSLTYIFYITIGNFVFNLSGIRQSLAVSIILVGYLLTLYVSSKRLRYLIFTGFIILAALFHASALFCLVLVVMLWVSQKRFKLSKILLAIFIIIPVVLPFTGFFESFLEDLMISRYENYEADSSRINIIAYFVIPYVIFIYLTYLKYYDKQTAYIPTENFAYLCSFMYVVSASASFYIPIINRMEFYFSLPMVSLIPTLTTRSSSSNRTTILVAIVIICALFFYIAQTDGILSIDNYTFSFD